jgi:hypothetical protein
MNTRPSTTEHRAIADPFRVATRGHHGGPGDHVLVQHSLPVVGQAAALAANAKAEQCVVTGSGEGTCPVA